jgi:hypothetical protein
MRDGAAEFGGPKIGTPVQNEPRSTRVLSMGKSDGWIAPTRGGHRRKTLTISIASSSFVSTATPAQRTLRLLAPGAAQSSLSGARSALQRRKLVTVTWNATKFVTVKFPRIMASRHHDRMRLTKAFRDSAICDSFLTKCGYKIVVDDSGNQPFLLRYGTIDCWAMNSGFVNGRF